MEFLSKSGLSFFKSLLDLYFATKSYVNKAISTNTGKFWGTYNSLADLQKITGSNGDYAYVIVTEDYSTSYDRYKWQDGQWVYEYTVGGEAFDDAQWAAINSGITSSDKERLNQISENIGNNSISEMRSDIDAERVHADSLIFDVTKENTGATFASLSALLSSPNLSTLIPTAVRTGGMTIRFVQSSDNKYVQYRYMGTATTGSPNPFLNTANWQGVDDAPTAESDNLVKSGGVYAEISQLEQEVSAHFNKIEDGLITSKEHFTCESAESNKYIDYATGGVVSFNGYFISEPIILHSNQKILTNITGGKPAAVIARYVDGSYSGLVKGTGSNTKYKYRNISDSDISVVICGYSNVIHRGYDIETLSWEEEVEKIADLQNATEGLQGDVENIVQLLPTNNIVVDKYDVSGYNSDDTGYNKYITNGGGIGTYSGYSILGPISLNKGDVLSSVVNGSGMAFLAKVNQDESMTPIILAPNHNTTQTIEYTAADDIVVMLSSNRTQFNGYTITGKTEAASKQSVDELSAKVDSMDNIHNICGDCALLDREILLLTNREYYFDDSYATETSYVNTSYLEQKIADVPKGKHFIFMTDSHIDYGHDIGKLQNETPVIKYVRDRLLIKNVIFGGDAIGVQPTKYKAAKVLSNYINKNFEAFGSGFLFVMGNHDTNPFVPSGGTIEDALISDVEVYKRTTRYMECYGIAKYPNKLIGIINTSNDLIDDSGNAMTQTQKNEFIAWTKHNYYYDDDNQKIRYIVLETGDGGNTMREIFGAVGDAGNSLMVIAYFLVDALINVPEDYDVVITAHWIVRGGAFWKKVFYKVLALYKNKSSDIVNFVPNTYQHPAVQPIVEKTFDNPASLSLTVDFTGNLGSGRIFCIDGHMHYDRATINEYVSDSDDISDDSFPLSTSESPQSKTYSAASILHITCDRCCAIEQYVNPEISNTYSYPNEISLYPDTGTARLGTIKEVLFDVVTITDDNRIVLTRFGAEGEQNSSPLVRDYMLPS